MEKTTTFFEQNQAAFAGGGAFLVTYFAVSMLGAKPCTAFFSGLAVGAVIGVGYNSEVANRLRQELKQTAKP